MNAYVINLARSTARREHMEGQLAEARLNATFIDAVDGAQLAAEHRARIDWEAVSRFPHWLLPGTLGCSLSHVEAYRSVLEAGDEVALILEDDAVLVPDAIPLLPRIAAAMSGSEVALLYYRCWGLLRLSRHDAVPLGASARLMYPLDLQGLHAAVAYLITRSAARSLSQVLLPIRAGADSWSFFHESGGIDRLRCVMPRPVRMRTDFKSAIDYLGDAETLKQRLMTGVAQRRIFPLYQLLAWKRALRERRMSRVELVDERSPFSQIAAGEQQT